MPEAGCAGAYTANEEWYLALTRRWVHVLRAGGEAGPVHPAGPDVDFAQRVLGLRPGMRILDLAAGWGRPSLEWARRGFSVTAFDLSPELLALGRERAEQAGLPVTFIQGTVRALPDLGTFDAVCAFYDDCLLSFEDEADNREALRRAARALRPGGGLLFGTTDCPPVLPPKQVVRRLQDGETVEETITFDAATRIGTSERIHLHDDGRRECFLRRRRHYTPDEAAALLAKAGLCVNAVYCGYDEALPYGTRPDGMVLVARRAAGV